MLLHVVDGSWLLVLFIDRETSYLVLLGELKERLVAAKLKGDRLELVVVPLLAEDALDVVLVLSIHKLMHVHTGATDEGTEGD